MTVTTQAIVSAEDRHPTFADRSITILKRLQTNLDIPTTITLDGYFYLVDFGERVRPRIHKVGKNGNCTCYLGKHCPAVAEVAAYLDAGGERVPNPPAGYYPMLPACCPICGAGVQMDTSLSSPKRGVGWRCTAGGSLHYWQRMTQALQAAQAQSPWVIAPVVDQAGQVIYAGVHRDDIVTEANNPYAFKDGYNPYR